MNRKIQEDKESKKLREMALKARCGGVGCAECERLEKVYGVTSDTLAVSNEEGGSDE